MTNTIISYTLDMKYLLFDADQTLYDFQASANIALKKTMNKSSIAYTSDNIELYEVGNRWCWDSYEEGTLSMDELKTKRFQLFFDKLSLHQDARIAGADYMDNLALEGIMLPGAISFLERIKDRRKSIITNGIAKVQIGRIEKTDTRKYFEHVFISEEIGSQKPHKEFFDHVLCAINKSPEDCLVIGDSDKSDIQGAINAGIDSVYISFDGRRSEKATYNVSSYEELYERLKTL